MDFNLGKISLSRYIDSESVGLGTHFNLTISKMQVNSVVCIRFMLGGLMNVLSVTSRASSQIGISTLS